MENFKNKTVFITGGSRGIGKAIGLRLAKQGANIVIAAKTDKAHPKLPGTIYTAADEIRQAGGKALPLVVDIRKEEMVSQAVKKTEEEFGCLDMLVNNASAINLSNTLEMDMKRFDLLYQVNSRGTFLVSKTCIPLLMKSKNPHILNLSPPLDLADKWFAPHVAYSIAKFNMSLFVLGMAKEFKSRGIGINALWPKTLIATAAVRNIAGGPEMIKKARSAKIVADAAGFILKRDSRSCTGNFFIDEEVLKEEGIKDFDQYAIDPDSKLQMDLFI